MLVAGLIYINTAFFPDPLKNGTNFPKQLLKLPTQRPSSLPWGPRPGPIEHLNFFYFYITSTNSLHCFLAHIARAQHISAEDGLYCPLQIRHLDLDLFGIRWAPFCLETPKKPSSFPSNQRSVSWYLRYLNNSLNLHQMYQWKTEDSEYIAGGSTERFAYTFMYSNTQFRTKNLSIITFRMKIHYSWYGYTEEFKISHAS